MQQEPKTHYTAKELAGLPGLPGTERGVQKVADRENWPFQKRQGRGGGREYPLSALPQATRDHLLNAMIAALPEKLCTLPAVIEEKKPAALDGLTRRQIDIMDARVWFMRCLEQGIKSIGQKKAIAAIIKGIDNGDPTYCAMAERANDRKSEGRTLSPRTLKRWWGPWRDSGKNPAALAPADADSRRVSRDAILVEWVRDYVPGALAPPPAALPLWLPHLLDEYRRPQKPTMADSVRKMRLPVSIARPSYEQVKRITDKLPEVYLQKGRLTGAEYKALLGFARRDASEYKPFTIGQIDGHSFKAYVAHPTTGAHFHPEVCGIICLTTKVLAGFSAGLAESSRTVADAYRHACTINDEKKWGGVFAIVEPDRGAGNMAKVNAHEMTGQFARIGTTFLPPETGGNPQGHGAIERSNQSIWIRAAKELITYTGKDMDRVTRKRVYERLERDLKKVKKEGKLGRVEKTSELLLSWREFLDALERYAQEYNNTPHSALPKITCPQTGRRRHMSPFEALAEHIARGWQPVAPPPEFLPHLFMPHEVIDVKRCEFTLHTNRYHAYELHNHHDRQMIAAYDIHNPETVWVLDLNERPVCQAKWNGNRVHARPVSVVEKAIMDRADRQTKNLENKLEMRRREAEIEVEIVPTHIELSVEVIEGEKRREEEARQKVISLEQSRRLRDVTTPTDVYYLILDRIKEGTVTPYQQQWKKDFEYWDETAKKVGLLKDDPYCLHDPAEKREKVREGEG